MSINRFSLIVLLISFLVVYFTSLKSKVNLIDTKNLPEIVFIDFNFNRLDTSGLLIEIDSEISEKSGDIYRFFKAELNRKNNKSQIENINANNIEFRHNKYIKLSNGFIYKKISDNLQIYGKNMFYDIKKHTLSSEDEFTLVSKKVLLIGKSFKYFDKKDIFKSKKIKAIVKGII